MRLLEALEQAAADHGCSALVVAEPSGKLLTLREAIRTFSKATLFRDIEVGEWVDGQLSFEAPNLTLPGDPVQAASFWLPSEVVP